MVSGCVEYTTRRYKDLDAKALSELIRRNFMEVNIADYPKEEMDRLSESYDESKVREVAGCAHMYVVLKDAEIVGTGSISSYRGSRDESVLLAIFVKPEYHRQGVGRVIMDTLENDELFLRAKRIKVPASITAYPFYEKLGYVFEEGVKKLDKDGLYKMQKLR